MKSCISRCSLEMECCISIYVVWKWNPVYLDVVRKCNPVYLDLGRSWNPVYLDLVW
jgi:hypothetical protein